MTKKHILQQPNWPNQDLYLKIIIITFEALHELYSKGFLRIFSYDHG